MFGLRSARSRAIVAGVVFLVLLATFAGLATRRAHDIERQHDELELTSVQATAFQHALAHLLEAKLALSSLIFSGDPGLVDIYDKAAAALEQDLSQARAQAVAEGATDKLLTLDDLTERIVAFNETVRGSLPFLLELDLESRVQLATVGSADVTADVDAFSAELDRLANNEQDELATGIAAADRAVQTTLWMFIGFGAAGVVVSISALAVLVMSVVRPLASLKASARVIASGDLEARAKVSGPQELACLARDFNEMTDALAAKTQELEVRAITDSLTGLYNHAQFFQRLAEETERSQRYEWGFAVVMLDVDNFKQYNDCRGHQAGDIILHLLADCIRAGLRSSDLAFRYGGDEFALILLRADRSRAQAIVKRMNRDISRTLKEMNDSASDWLALSAGVACFPEDATTADELVRIADAALYDTKRARTPA